MCFNALAQVIDEQKRSAIEYTALLLEQFELREQGYHQEREPLEKLKKRHEALSKNIENFTLNSLSLRDQ
jgi:phage shock protein A